MFLSPHSPHKNCAIYTKGSAVWYYFVVISEAVHFNIKELYTMKYRYQIVSAIYHIDGTLVILPLFILMI